MDLTYIIIKAQYFTLKGFFFSTGMFSNHNLTSLDNCMLQTGEVYSYIIYFSFVSAFTLTMINGNNRRTTLLVHMINNLPKNIEIIAKNLCFPNHQIN